MSGIDFSPVAADTANSMLKVVDYILGLNISPSDKVDRIAKSIDLVGADFYTKMFNDNSELFDSTAIGSADYGDMTDQVQRLAVKTVRNNSLSRNVSSLIGGFYNSALGRAQAEAFSNAVSLDKHPTLTRSIVGETCGWCIKMAGVHINPTPEMFGRHENCDCLFVTSGYKSRNGVLTNYSKRGSASRARSSQNDYINDIFGNNKPSIGNKVVEKSRQDRAADGVLADYLINKYGGKYVVLSDVAPNGVKTPDIYLENMAFFESKNISSKTSVDSQIHKAISQLSNDNLTKLGYSNSDKLNHVIVLNVTNGATLTNEVIKDLVMHRIFRDMLNNDVDIDYVMVKRPGIKDWYLCI